MPAPKERIFKLPYWISNNGDGSASANFVATREEAAKQDEEQSEGWGEPCDGDVTLKVVGDKLYFSEFGEIGKTADGKTKYGTIWVEVEQD